MGVKMTGILGLVDIFFTIYRDLSTGLETQHGLGPESQETQHGLEPESYEMTLWNGQKKALWANGPKIELGYEKRRF